MLWKTFILYHLLGIITLKYEVLAEDFQNFEHEISSHVKITVKHDNVNQVQFNNVSCTIHYYNLTVKPEADEIRSKSMQFYFCISCMFADWIRNALFKTIEGVPLFYSSKLKSSNNDEFRNTISVSTLASIANNNERFIDILFNIINMYTYATHIDTDLLKSLLILHFKFNFIKKLYEYDHNIENSENVTIGKDDVIIPLILESINDLQKFSSLNCDVSSLYHHDNNQVHGYSMNQPGSDGLNIEKFFDDIKPMGRESHNQCTVERILLRHVLDSDDLVSREISNIRLYVQRGRVVLKDILTEVGDSYNLEMVLWYLRMVHESIVKIVCTKVLVVLKSRKEFDTNTVRVLSEIGFLFTEYMNLPQKLVDVFRLIISSSSSSEKNEKPILDVSKYEKMENGIWDYLDGRQTPSTDTDNVYDAFRLPFFNVKVITDKTPLTSLDDFLHAIVVRMVDYRCMANTFAYLNAEKGKYYLPHVQRSFTVYEFVKNRLLQLGLQEKKTSGKVPVPVDQWWPKGVDHAQIADDPSQVTVTCDYLTAVYHHCVKVSVAAVDACRNDSTSCVSELRDQVSAVTTHLQLNLFSTGDRSATLSQIAFDVVPTKLIVADPVLRETDTSGTPATELLTYLHLIMTALNGYAIRRCRPPTYNYLLFNKVGIDASTATGNRKRFAYKIDERPADEDADDDVHLAVLKLYGIFEAELNRHKWFHDGAPLVEPQVRFYWRGEPMTFDDIFFNIRTTVMNPAYMYEYVDVYYKHVLAAMYCETYAYFNRLRATISKRLPRNNDVDYSAMYYTFISTDLLPSGVFPKPFNYLVQRFNEFVKFFFLGVLRIGVYPKTFPAQRPLANEFVRLGVIVPDERLDIPAVCNENNETQCDEEIETNTFKENISQVIFSMKVIKKIFTTHFLDKFK